MKNKDDNFIAADFLDVITAMQERRSIRAFLDKPVSSDTLQAIFEAAKFAPSGVNTQPWKIAVLGSKHRQKISDAIISAKEKNIPPHPDYHYYPEEWFEPYKSRRKACGMALYSALGIQVGEAEKRKVQWYRNYYFFHAPIALIFYLDAKLGKGSWMDMGMFLQNIMLAARHFGLETCPQAALAEYPDIIRSELNISVDQHIICGIAMGYADWENPVNQYRTSREKIEDFTTWLD